jgi:membrane protease YdiL (CAAX protease family)
MVINILSVATFLSTILTGLVSQWLFEIKLISFNVKSIFINRIIFYSTLPLVIIFLAILIIIYFDGIVNRSINSEFEIRISVILFFLFAAVSEEILFRVVIFKIFQNNPSYNRYSIFLSAAFFAFVHFVNGLNLISMLNLFLAGVFLSLVYLQTNTIFYPVLFHFFWNVCQGMIFGFRVSGVKISSLVNLDLTENSFLNGDEFGLEGSIITTLIYSILILIYFFLNRVNFAQIHADNKY